MRGREVGGSTARVTAMTMLVATTILAASADPIESFLDGLLAKMSVKEKARQLVIDSGDGLFDNGLFSQKKIDAYTRGLGAGVLDSMARNVDPHLYNQIQQAVVASSKHGIGAIFADECQHGVQGDHHTIFPSPYTVAATFDRELMEQIGGVIGAEARAQGTTQCWSPVCGLAREPRWGRSEEEMGEDAYLAGELAAAMVRGMTARSNLTDPRAVAPLLKHFAAHSVPESGRNAAPAHLGRREVQETFLPVFAKAVKAGALGVMSRYNEVDGVPTTTHRRDADPSSLPTAAAWAIGALQQAMLAMVAAQGPEHIDGLLRTGAGPASPASGPCRAMAHRGRRSLQAGASGDWLAELVPKELKVEVEELRFIRQARHTRPRSTA